MEKDYTYDCAMNSMIHILTKHTEKTFSMRAEAKTDWYSEGKGGQAQVNSPQNFQRDNSSDSTLISDF